MNAQSPGKENDTGRPPSLETEGFTGVSFDRFHVGFNSINQIPGINNPLIDELGAVFDKQPKKPGDWTIEELGELIKLAGKSKVFLDNVPNLTKTLPGHEGKKIATDWVTKSGLLVPVFRNFENPELEIPVKFDHTLITGGVRNWMIRRADLLIKLKKGGLPVDHVYLAAGNREMKVNEGQDVLVGDTEATYLKRIIAPLLEDLDIQSSLITPETDSGSELAREITKNLDYGNLLVVCNAGNWIKNAGQIRRAPCSDKLNLFVISDEFPLATNNEPPSTHQNPFSAISQIARNMQELRHYK